MIVRTKYEKMLAVIMDATVSLAAKGLFQYIHYVHGGLARVEEVQNNYPDDILGLVEELGANGYLATYEEHTNQLT